MIEGKVSVAEDKESVLNYAKPDTREGPPTPPLHFWIRLVLFALIGGAFALPLLIKR